MPPARPRYTVSDTGEISRLLDLAARAWPHLEDRGQLLVRLVEVGGRVVEAEIASPADRQRAGLDRAAALVNVDALLADGAWR